MITPMCFRYGTHTQLQALTGIAARNFARWTINPASMPMSITEYLATTYNVPLDDLLQAWSDRATDAVIRREHSRQLTAVITRLDQENNHRYRQLKLPCIPA